MLHGIVPPQVAVAPEAVILVATDPPDPLIDVVRKGCAQARFAQSGGNGMVLRTLVGGLRKPIEGKRFLRLASRSCPGT